MLLTALREERGDTELVRGILECLVLALQPSERARPVHTRQPSHIPQVEPLACGIRHAAAPTIPCTCPGN